MIPWNLGTHPGAPVFRSRYMLIIRKTSLTGFAATLTCVKALSDEMRSDSPTTRMMAGTLEFQFAALIRLHQLHVVGRVRGHAANGVSSISIWVPQPKFSRADLDHCLQVIHLRLLVGTSFIFRSIVVVGSA